MFLSFLYAGTRSESPATPPPAVQTYMELDQRTREGQQVYQEPHPRLHQGAEFSTYENVDEGSNISDDEYQELDQPTLDNSSSTAYVNVPQWNREKGKH